MVIRQVITIGYKPLLTLVRQQSGNYQKDGNRIKNCHKEEAKARKAE